MIKISLGTKPAFFFCGSIALSRKTNAYATLDPAKLSEKEIKGLLRAQKTGAINVNEGLDLLEKIDTTAQEVDIVVEPAIVEEKPVVEEIKIEVKEEENDGQKTNEEGQQEVTQEVLSDSEVSEIAPVKATRTSKKKV